MWTGFAAKLLYEKKVTVMEMICASPCLVAMVCFSLEVERGNLLNEELHMARHRVGSRGNVTCFPLPLQELYNELQRTDSEEGRLQCALPRTGVDLQDAVKILLKGSQENIAKLITQATVRRNVVVELILEAKARGHLSYRHVSEEDVWQRAKDLPENGAPPEVIHILELQRSLDNLIANKNASPASGRVDEKNAFDHCRPNAVVDEKSSTEGGDINARRITALTTIVDQLQTDKEGGQGDIVVSTGSDMLDQFQPWFFSIAFAFCFKSGIACPDLKKRNRYRRIKSAPEVTIERWCELMVRRVEAQFRRDWTFTYTLWNYLFRTAVNTSRTVYSYSNRKDNDLGQKDCQDLEDAAVSICKAMRGTYTGPDGIRRKVNGDMTKVRYAIEKLSSTAQKLVSNIEHTTRKIAGTHEIRRKMRHMTHSYRVIYGQPLFITMSPDEKHNIMYLKLSRTRQKDPVNIHDQKGTYLGQKNQPSLNHTTLALDANALNDLIPDYEERRKLMARDPLAASDGFRTMCSLVLEHLFGLRFCPFCPDCSNDRNACADLCGSNASPEGEIFES